MKVDHNLQTVVAVVVEALEVVGAFGAVEDLVAAGPGMEVLDPAHLGLGD